MKLEPIKTHEGLCAGGPSNGKYYVSNTQYLNIPVMYRDGIGLVTYEWHDVIRMWIVK
jgi:hypothetical protein